MLAETNAFPPEERAKELKELELSVDFFSLQRSLSLNWHLQTDSLDFLVSREEKLFTKRAILSTASSIFDPLGFVAPITIQGKVLVRELCAQHCEWDAPIPAENQSQWKAWKDSLKALKQLHIPRPYIPVSLHFAHDKELCVFFNASTMAISAVAYLRTVNDGGQIHVALGVAKSKLTPQQSHTVPRLELCAAVELSS